MSDREVRARFEGEIEQPFSVIAPAGAGKTRAIIGRVRAMLQAGKTPLALVTYTKKAAQEMRERLEARLRSDKKSLPAQGLFIGTIHSFCHELIKKNAKKWALPQNIQLATNLKKVYASFEAEEPNPLDDFSTEIQKRFWRHFEMFREGLLELVDARKIAENEFTQAPPFPFHKIKECQISGPAKKPIERLRVYAEALKKTVEDSQWVMPELPKYPEKTSKAYPFFREFFEPYEKWKGQQGMLYAQHIAWRFARWRREKGIYFFEDLIAVTFEKIREYSEAGTWNIVLDEAQDTSPKQMEILRALAARKERKIQLTMVGDPQQTIFPERASIAYYLKMHQELQRDEGVEALTLEQTFRCSREVVDWVNKVGPALLQGGAAQAEYVQLEAREDASEGGVFRWKLPAPSFSEIPEVEKSDWAVAREVAKKIMALKIPEGRAHEIAVLALQKRWLHKLRITLIEEGLRVQIHAPAGPKSAAYKTLQSLIYLLWRPFDSFELVGLLREISACSDLELSRVTKNTPQVLSLMESAPLPEDMPVALREEMLALRASWAGGRKDSLIEALKKIIAAINLDEKMLALGGVYGAGFAQEWRQTKMWIFSLATQCHTAAELLEKMETERAELAVERGAIQLMSIHKAKGLEWPIVVLPFLHRPNNDGREKYPYPDLSSKKLLWQDDEKTEDGNLNRLLYVAQTRAKEALILVDDAKYYKTATNSAAARLGIAAGGCFEEAFKQLGPPGFDWGEVCEQAEARAPVEWQTPQDCPVRSPTSFVDEEAIRGKGKEEGGLEYGDAWHGLWARGIEFVKKVERFKYPRLKAELEALKKHSLWQKIASGNASTEVPFFAKIDGMVLEGRVDLLLETPEGVCVVDWKTDQMPLEQIAEIYKPQMLAYKAAFEKLSGKAVSVYLYATMYAQSLEF